MIALKILEIIVGILIIFFVVTFVIYFFNLDMKLMAALTGPLTKYYDWAKSRRDAKKKKTQEKQQTAGEMTEGKQDE